MNGGDCSGFILANPLGCAANGGDRAATLRRGATLAPIGLAIVGDYVVDHLS